MASRINLRDPTDIASLLFLLLIGILTLSGVVYLINGTLGIFLAAQEEFIRITPSAIRAFNPELMILIQVFEIMLGLLFTTLTIAGLFIFRYGFRKKEKWAWFAFLTWLPLVFLPSLLLVSAGSTIISQETIITTLVTTVILTIIHILALAISYREFFK